MVTPDRQWAAVRDAQLCLPVFHCQQRQDTSGAQERTGQNATRLTPARGPEHGSPLVVALKASWRNACYKRDSSLVARSEAPRAQVRHSQSCCRSDHFPGTAGEHYLSSRRKSPDHAVDREASSQTEGFDTVPEDSSTARRRSRAGPSSWVLLAMPRMQAERPCSSPEASMSRNAKAAALSPYRCNALSYAAMLL